MTRNGRATATIGSVLTSGLVLATCGSATDPDATPIQLVLVTPDAPGEYNPVDGYGELGVSPLFDGLLALDSTGDDRLPEFVPALAAGAPEPNEDQTVWEVPVRTDVTFSNGEQLTADDVDHDHERRDALARYGAMRGRG